MNSKTLEKMFAGHDGPALYAELMGLFGLTIQSAQSVLETDESTYEDFQRARAEIKASRLLGGIIETLYKQVNPGVKHGSA